MKLYITINKPIPNSYVGLDLAHQKVDFSKMDDICEQAECTEIITDEILSYITVTKVGALIGQIISRLRKGGKIIIRDIDLMEVTKMYQNGMLNTEEINNLLYAGETLNKNGAYSHTDIQDIINKYGLEIISIDLSLCHYTLIARRK